MNKHNPNPIRKELESLKAVQQRLHSGGSWHDVVIQNVDLTSVDAAMAKVDICGCYFLGCTIGSLLAAAIAGSFCSIGHKRPCLIFPAMEGLPFNPYRASLYAPEDLLGKFTAADVAAQQLIYQASVDWRSYLSFADPVDAKTFTNDSLDTVLARRLHDTAISDALADLLERTRAQHAATGQGGVVAIMGGHDMPRQEKVRNGNGNANTPLGAEPWEGMADDTTYTRVALMSWKLTQEHYLLVTGGGPGAMEACNLGAYFASRSLDELREGIRMLESFKEFKIGKSVEWLIPAMAVRRKFPLGKSDAAKCQSIGIPTWFYGHEPPNPFATQIAKYFENSVREEGLLAIATHGVIFAEGNAGTVQELFQEACQNYYATYGTAAPMILFGQDYWDPPTMPIYVNDKRKKAFPLLRKLAEEKGFTHRLVVTDSLKEIVRTIVAFKP